MVPTAPCLIVTEMEKGGRDGWVLLRYATGPVAEETCGHYSAARTPALQMHNHRRPSTCGAVDPKFNVGLNLLRRSAAMVEWILNLTWANASVGGVREGVVFFAPPRSLCSTESKSSSSI